MKNMTILEIDCAIRFCDSHSKTLEEIKITERERLDAKELKMTPQEFEEEMKRYDDEILDWQGYKIDLLEEMERRMEINKKNYRDSFDKK